MELHTRLNIQRPQFSGNDYTPLPLRVNNGSAIDNYIIAKVSARDRFILRPQQYNLFIESALKDIENNLDDLINSI